MNGQIGRTVVGMGCCQVRLPAIITRCVLLVTLLVTLSACSFPVQPRYQPLSANSILSLSRQGYEEFQIDHSTYFITYDNYGQNYLGIYRTHELLKAQLDDKWLQGAQEYVLYRAGELAKSKGVKHFAILHKDDWNLIDISSSSKYGRDTIVRPGAGLMIKILHDYPPSIPPNDDRIYEVETLLQSLTEKNAVLAAYQNKTPPNESLESSRKKLSRWRTAVSDYDSVPVPGQWVKSFFGDRFEFQPGHSITKEATGRYHVAVWSNPTNQYGPLLQVRLLQECAQFAEQVGFEVFKLENWIVEEHRDTTAQGDIQKVWFRTTATVTLQHRKEPGSLDPVFVVDEIRANVMNNK